MQGPGTTTTDDRSTTAAGRSRALVDLPLAFDPGHLAATPSARCVQTLLPLADRLGVPVHLEPVLNDHVVRGRRHPSASVLCGDAGPVRDAVAALHERPGGSGARVRAGKGSVWVLGLHERRLLSSAHLRAPA